MKNAKWKVESGKAKCRSTRRPAHSPFPFPLSPLRSGISLIEILISIFVLLIGLSGVAFIFPVGNHYIVEGEKHDLGSSLAQNAFEELVARGMLRPEAWLYVDRPPGGPATNDFIVQQTNSTPPPNKTKGFFNMPLSSLVGDDTYPFGPGHAFVLDPLGADSVNELRFPFSAVNLSSVDNNPWLNPATGFTLEGNVWPIRRITLPTPDPTGTFSFIPMPGPVAETIFRLRDDLAVDQPDQDDWPSIQRWDIDTSTTIPSLLRRQYKGDYSWLATIVPTSAESLAALQPAVPTNDYGEQRYEVSVVVFRRREVAPSETSERLIEAEMLNDGELAIYHATDPTVVDAAVDEISEGNWIAVAGVNQTTGDFAMKWYRILSMDRETDNVTLNDGSNPQGRYLALDGPDWPDNSFANLRAIIMPGVISVATHPLHMEDFSLWSLE